MRAGQRTAVALGALAAMLAMPLVVTSGFWMDFLILTLFVGVLGQGWNILGGYGGQLSFGHAVFFGTGAYVQAILQTQYGWNPWLAITPAVLAGVLVGAFIGYLSFRYGLRGSYFALITLAFAEAFRVLATSIEITEGGQGIYLRLNRDPDQAITMLQFASGVGYYYMILALTVVALLVAWWIEHSRFGAQLMAVRENEDAAEALGIDAFAVKMRAICISAALTASAGVFYVQKFLLMDPFIAFGPGKSVEALVAPIIGGMGTIFGPLLGSIVLHGVGELTKALTAAAGIDHPGLDLVIYGILLVLMLAFLPSGLMGLLRRRARPARSAEHA
ncbi:branched-chain amino acid ABC transporter permease [Oceanibacterium hippocampi]|uniref:High-affinity branched-chain amino acid transport system permease protein LivH n=1 Tax=Oceanibacterium hippocampi TaxID=745714 RepID=A0A1Y5TT52_9PROT|nr:branched-chain amino acid ABC transporter permease [Oceanibacterium hippocampi]SLN71477.1 High-affinity branched-chain amino acid transport system permease protein LivH [Oceanibacterium hippocampi]